MKYASKETAIGISWLIFHTAYTKKSLSRNLSTSDEILASLLDTP